MNLKALTFDIIGTLFDVHRGLAKGVGPLNTKYSINVSGQPFSHGSIAGYAGGVVAVNGGGAWTPPDLILRAATRDNLPIQHLGAKAPQTVEDFFHLWRALPPGRM